MTPPLSSFTSILYFFELLRSMLTHMPQRCLSFLCLLAVFTAGCETAPQMDYGKVDLVDVSGTVKLDGAPLPDAVITFEDPATGTYAFALTDSGGGYTLQFDSVKNGCTPGRSWFVSVRPAQCSA